MLTKLIGSRARQTSDVDFSIGSDELYGSIKEKLVEVCKHFISMGIIDEYVIKESIQPRTSGGVVMKLDGHIVLGVDVGWHDITYGTRIINLDVGEVNAFMVERMISDKLLAILSRKRFRRSKDLYDLFVISECMDFNAKLVHDFMVKRSEGGIVEDWKNYPFSEKVLVEYKKAYSKLNLESIYKGVTLVKPDFDDVIYRLKVISEKVKEPNDCVMWCSRSHWFKE